MIKYFNESPLWNYILKRGPSLKPIQVQSAILVNNNLVKGHIAMRLFKDGYKLLDFMEIARMSKLSQYDLHRVQATFRDPNIPALTGYQRYSVALPTLYIKEITSRTQKYRDYFLDLAMKNQIDIIDLFILVNQKSSVQDLVFMSEHIRRIRTPKMFVPHIEEVLIEREKEIPSKVLMTFLEHFEFRGYKSIRLELILTLRNVKQGLRSQIKSKIVDREHIQILLEGMQINSHKLLYNSVTRPIKTELLHTFIQLAIQIQVLEQGVLQTNLLVYKTLMDMRGLLPKWSVLRDKVPAGEKQMRIQIFEVQKRLRGVIQKNLRRKKMTQNKQRLVDYIQLARKYNLSQKYLGIDELKQHLISNLNSNPILYLNFPDVFISTVRYSVQLNQNASQCLKLLQKYSGSLSDTRSLVQLHNVLQARGLELVLLEALISKSMDQTTLQLPLVDYLQNAEIYDRCGKATITSSSSMQLLVYCINNEITADLRLLDQPDRQNLKNLSKIMRYRGRQAVLELGIIRATLGNTTTNVTESPLLQPLFQMLQQAKLELEPQKTPDDFYNDEQYSEEEAEISIDSQVGQANLLRQVQ